MALFYFKELTQLRDHLFSMADYAMNAVNLSMQSLENGDSDLAKAVIANDAKIDQLELDIDAEASRYIALRAPVTTDVRLVTIAIKASHDLERIGDEAKTIAKRTIRFGKRGHKPDLGQLQHMADLAVGLVREAVGCMTENNSEAARNISQKDKEIDQMHKSNYKYFTTLIVENPDLANTYVDLIFISKALERVGDHAKNIAEEVVYLVEGEDIRHSKDK